MLQKEAVRTIKETHEYRNPNLLRWSKLDRGYQELLTKRWKEHFCTPTETTEILNPKYCYCWQRRLCENIKPIWRCVYRASYCNVLMTNEMHNSYNQFYSTVFCLLYMFRTNLVVHHQDYGIIYCITQYNQYNRAYSTIVPIVLIVLCNTVYNAVLLMMNDSIRSKHVEQTKNCGIKIDYKNCASRWSLTHCTGKNKKKNVSIFMEVGCVVTTVL
jgi:hypothetical protein